MKRATLCVWDSSKETSLGVCRNASGNQAQPVPDKPGKITLNTHYACGYRMAGHKMASTPAHDARCIKSCQHHFWQTWFTVPHTHINTSQSMSLASMLHSPNGNMTLAFFRRSKDVCRQIRGQSETRDRCVPVSSNQAFQEQECTIFFYWLP